MDFDTEGPDKVFRMKNKQTPIHEVRLGRIKAAVWKNETEGGVRYNTTFTRLYKEKEDKDWKFTDSFGRDDLLLVSKVADIAHSWICEQQQEENGATKSVSRDEDDR